MVPSASPWSVLSKMNHTCPAQVVLQGEGPSIDDILIHLFKVNGTYRLWNIYDLESVTSPVCARQQIVLNKRSLSGLFKINITCLVRRVLQGQRALYTRPFNLLFSSKWNISTMKVTWFRKCDQSRVRQATNSTKWKFMVWPFQNKYYLSGARGHTGSKSPLYTTL